MYRMEDVYQERAAARAAAFLRCLQLGAWTILGRTGVRSDWREQDGPALFVMDKKGLVGDNGHPALGLHIKNDKHTDTINSFAAIGGAPVPGTDEGGMSPLTGSVSFFALFWAVVCR